MILSKLINDEIGRKGLSFRAAAREAGVAHSTIIRASRGEPVDIDILIKICAWLQVDPSNIIGGMVEGDSALVRNLAILIQKQPKLASTFTNLLAEFLSGGMTEEEVRDVINYASYKMSMRSSNVQPQNHSGDEGNRPPVRGEPTGNAV
jgi:transcriptional regulator with XRE-family HTH domain